MANLMGLLLGASPARLQAIARHWQIDADVEPRTLVSRLYDEMTDEQAVKSFVEGLGSRERLVLDNISALPRGWRSVKDLGAALPFSEEDFDLLLSDLTDAGMLLVEDVRVSDAGNEILEGPCFLNRTRPSAQVSIARIPADILRILQHISQEMSAGEHPEKSLHRLLGELDMPQLQLLSARWGLSSSQQPFKKELMLNLEAALAQECNIQAKLCQLGADASAVYRAVKDVQAHVALEQLRQSLSIDEVSLRRAASALMSHLLLQETYVNGERYLFIPGGVSRRDEALEQAEGAIPVEVPEPKRVLSVDYSFYFDLLALVNYFQLHQVELSVIERKIPRRVMAEIRDEITFAGRDSHGATRLEYLLYLARSLNLLEAKDERLAANAPRVREWAELGIKGQVEKLFRFWLQDDTWKGPLSTVSSATGKLSRRSVRQGAADCLKSCEPGKWYSFSSLVRCSLSQGFAGGRASTSVSDYETPVNAWPSRAEAQVFGVRVVRLFQWMSLLSIGFDHDGAVNALQLTPLGAWVFGCAGAEEPQFGPAALNVNANFEVTVLEPDTLVWYHLLKYALTVSVGRASVHQITRKKLQHAVYLGFGHNDLLSMLAARSRNVIPENVLASTEDWAGGVKIVNLEKPTVLEVEAETVLNELISCPKYARWFGRRLSPTVVIVQDGLDLKKLVREMKSDGYFPRLER